MGQSRLRRLLAASVSTAALAAGGLPLLTGTAAAVVVVGNTLSVSPNASINNETVQVHITGSTFDPESDTATLVNHGTPADTIAGTVLNSSSSSALDATFNLSAAAPTGYDVVVHHTSGPDDSCSSCFTVSSATPSLTSVSSPVAQRPETYHNLQMTGANFSRTMTLAFSPATGLTVSNVHVTSSTAATFDLDVASTAATGNHDAIITLADGQTATCTSCLQVHAPPSIDSVSPPGMAQGETHEVVISGSNFRTGAKVTFTNAGNTVTATNETVTNNGTTLTVTIAVPADASVGGRNLVVTNFEGGHDNTAFTISAQPTVTSVSPDSGSAGVAANVLTVTGSGFVTGTNSSTTRTQFAFSGAGVSISNTTVTDSTHATLTVAIASDAASGPRDLTATNIDFGSATCDGCFTVNGAPTVTSTDPSFLPVGATDNVQIYGTGFRQTSTGPIVNNPTVAIAGVTVNGEATYVDSTHLTVNVTVPSGAAQGDHTVTVTNPAPDSGTGSCATCFSVTGITVSSISPTALANDGTHSTTVNGVGFGTSPSPQVSFRANDAAIPAGSQPDIQATNETSPAPTSSSIKVSADLTAAAPGTYDVRVVNADGGTGVCQKCLTVTAATPTTSAISSPPRIAPGQTRTFTLTGTHFAHGLHVTSSTAGVTVGAVTFVSTTSATVVLSAAADATPADTGLVKVVNTDNKTSNGQTLTIAHDPALDVTLPANIVGGAAATVGSVDVSNPADGGAFNGRVDFTLSGVPGLSADEITFQYQNSSDAWVDIPLVAGPDTDTFVGYLPPQGGSAIAPGDEVSVPVRIAVTQSGHYGTLNVASSFGDVTGTARTDTVATDSDDVVVKQKPGAPTSVQATAGNASATVSWSAPTNTGSSAITSYTIVPSPACGSCTGTTTPNGSTVESTVNGLTNGQAYTFTVIATNSVGNGPASDPSVSTTPAGVPAPPSNVTAVGSTDSAIVSWSASSSDNGSDIVSYTVIPSPACASCTGVTTSDGSATSTTVQGLTDGVAYTFTVVATNGVGNSDASGASNAVTPLSGATFKPLGPTRILDTRTTTPRSTIPAHGTLLLKVAGVHGVASNASSVIVNATTTGQQAAGYLTVYPTNSSNTRPTASNMNFTALTNTPVLVSVAPGQGGKISLYNGSSGKIDVVLDLFGYNTPLTDQSTLHSVAPVRVLDTRTSTGGHHAAAAPGEIWTQDVGVPDGATAAVLNVTATGASSGGHLTVYPADLGTPPSASNLNYGPGAAVANLAVVPVDSAGRIKVQNASGGSVHVVLDLAGYYLPNPDQSAFHGQAPVRLLDTRSGGGAPVASHTYREITVAGANGVPASGATGVVVTVTAVNGSTGGYLTAYPADADDVPGVSNVNYPTNYARANLAFVPLSADGKIRVYNGGAGTVHVIVDQAGYFTQH